MKHVSSKEMDINEVKYLKSEELDKIKIDRRIIAGFRKDLHNIICLSEDYNTARNVPTIDLRTFKQDCNTGKMEPTVYGFRLDPSQYAALFNMMNNNLGIVYGTTSPDEGSPTEQSEHLAEQMKEADQAMNGRQYLEEEMAIDEDN